MGLPSPQQVRLSRRPSSSTSYKPSITGLASTSGADDAVFGAVVVPGDAMTTSPRSHGPEANADRAQAYASAQASTQSSGSDTSNVTTSPSTV